MKKVTITIDDYLYEFYKKVGENAGGLRPKKVMSDALFKLAGELSLGELSLNVIKEKNKRKVPTESA